MKHFVFHLPMLVSVEEADEDAGGALVIKDHSRRAVDFHVWAEDVDSAADNVTEKLQILLGEDPPDAPAVDTVGFPYIGPV